MQAGNCILLYSRLFNTHQNTRRVIFYPTATYGKICLFLENYPSGTFNFTTYMEETYPPPGTEITPLFCTRIQTESGSAARLKGACVRARAGQGLP